MAVQAKRKSRPSGRAGRCRGVALETAIDPRRFRALSDPTRIHLLIGLARGCGAQTVTQAAERCAVDPSEVSRHLAVLRDAGVVAVRKDGRRSLYTVRYAEIARRLRALADAIDACCPEDDSC